MVVNSFFIMAIKFLLTRLTILIYKMVMEKLRQYLKGKDRAEWAAKFGTTVQYLNLLLAPKSGRRPGADLARAISKETGISLEDLLFN